MKLSVHVVVFGWELSLDVGREQDEPQVDSAGSTCGDLQLGREHGQLQLGFRP